MGATVDNGAYLITNYKIEKFDQVSNVFISLISYITYDVLRYKITVSNNDIGKSVRYRLKAFKIIGYSLSNEINILALDLPSNPIVHPLDSLLILLL